MERECYSTGHSGGSPLEGRDLYCQKRTQCFRISERNQEMRRCLRKVNFLSCFSTTAKHHFPRTANKGIHLFWLNWVPISSFLPLALDGNSPKLGIRCPKFTTYGVVWPGTTYWLLWDSVSQLWNGETKPCCAWLSKLRWSSNTIME